MRTNDLKAGEVYASKHGQRVRLVMTGTLWTSARRGPAYLVSTETQGRHGSTWEYRFTGHLFLTGAGMETVKIPDITGTNAEMEATVAAFKAGLPEDVSLNVFDSRRVRTVSEAEREEADRAAAADAAKRSREEFVAMYDREIVPLLERFRPDGYPVQHQFYVTDCVSVPVASLRAIAAYVAKGQTP